MGTHLLERLSERQCQLLELVGQDVTASKTLAIDTGLSPGTIDNLLQSAAKALEVQGRIAAARRYKELSAQSDDVPPVAAKRMDATPPPELAAPDPEVLPLPSAGHHLPVKPGRSRMKSALMVLGVVAVVGTLLALLLHTAVAMFGYTSCNMARLLGAAPIAKDQPGYHLALDRDRDGLACE